MKALVAQELCGPSGLVYTDVDEPVESADSVLVDVRAAGVCYPDLLLIGGKVAPYVLARIPQGGEVRGNLAAGGKGVAQPLSDENRAVAEAIAPVLAARGLLLVGLDMIGNKVTEINVTSPTCFQEIHDQTGVDVPAMFADALLDALGR